MDQSTSSSKLPRPSNSRLPVRAGLRPVPSRENLQQSSRLALVNPRLRPAPSREQLSGSTRSPIPIARPRDSSPRGRQTSAGTVISSTGTVIYNPQKQSNDGHLRRNLQLSLREEDQGSVAEGEVTKEGGASPGGNVEQISSTIRHPSLSERTKETLQNIPSSPAVSRRSSIFFNNGSPPRPPSRSSRPGSSYQKDTSVATPFRSFSSRPSSSSGPGTTVPVDFRASTNTFRPPQSTLAQTPVKRPNTTKTFSTPSNARSTKPPGAVSSKQSPMGLDSPLRQRRQSPVRLNEISKIKTGSKTLSARPLKPRASINGLFRKPSMPALDQSSELDRIGFVAQKKSTTFSNASSDGSNVSKESKATTMTSASAHSPDVTPRKSSLALRDQIAKAKAAKRAASGSSKTASSNETDHAEVPVIPSGTFDFGLSDDPFNQQINQNGAKGLLRKRIDAARTDGRLNIAAMGFKEMPEEVMNMYNLESIGANGGSWAESVDLTRFIAAGNDFEVLSDDVFPDIDPRDTADAEDAEDAKGNQFGGLETLDLHDNVLVKLPLGLRRLELLTTLNLSNNKLGNDCFQVISQIPSLRDLKLAGNGLSGPLDSSITSLRNLEALDVQRNELTSLPEGLAELVRLRVLNLTENHFASLPFEALCQLPLIELTAIKNKLSGVLIPAHIDELPHLRILDVTSNTLTSLTDSTLKLPVIHQLSCSSNRLIGLPDMTSWVSLLTIAAEDNNISTIPEGFVTLPIVKTVNFSGNNLKVLDDSIGAMDSLDIFRISGNPLREKKFSGMTTEDLKRALKARMAPIEQEVEKEMDDGAFYSAQASPTSTGPSSEWLVKAGGVLDRSNTGSYSLNPVKASHVAQNNSIRELQLHHNSFKEIPSSIAFFAATLTTLSLAHNELTNDKFLNDDLELPTLKELNLSSNTFNSLQPLIQHLKAPQLEKLDISFNRLTSLPVLRAHFPSLVNLFASHNTIRELSPESVKGLRILDCSSNDINSLNARIGLLGGPGRLERLDVSGNRFRVPKYTILEKGTEATLAWLRDRIPAGELVEPPSPTDVD